MGATGGLWWHLVLVVAPDELLHPGWAGLWITAAPNRAPPSPRDSDVAVASRLAVSTGAVVAALFNVPNEALFFVDEPGQPLERGRHRCVHVGALHQPRCRLAATRSTEAACSWVLELPMTKAAFAAMRAVEEHRAVEARARSGGERRARVARRGRVKARLDDMASSARSTRARARARRVRAIAPLVLDALDLRASLHHHFAAYGGWTFAFEDYWRMNITARLDEPETASLFALIDPISYAERFAGLPKLVGDATNDEFFLPDDWRYWIERMPAPTSFFMAPNAEHSLATALPSLLPSVEAFFAGVMGDATVPPAFSWAVDYASGTIRVTFDDDLPKTVAQWTGRTCSFEAPRRDFRLLNLDAQTLNGSSACACGFGADASADGGCVNARVLFDNATLAPEAGSAGRVFDRARRGSAARRGRWVAFFVAVTYHGVKEEAAEAAAPRDESAQPRARVHPDHSRRRPDAHGAGRDRARLPPVRVRRFGCAGTLSSRFPLLFHACRPGCSRTRRLRQRHFSSGG